MPNLKKILSISILLSVLLIPACSSNNGLAGDDKRIVAEINDYKLTIADFKAESRNLSAGNYSPADFEKAKENILDEIITKKVLIQEAQKENFDKDKAFIKEIERYWEQALLKLLYNKKSQELLNKIRLEAGETEDMRSMKVRQAISDWVDGLKSRADIKKYEENLKAIGQE